MDKRTILALILIFVVFFISSKFLWKQPTPPQQQTTIEQKETVQKKPQKTKPINAVMKEVDTGTFITDTAVERNDNLILENDEIIAIFTNKGGNIRQVILKNIMAETKDKSVELFITEKGMFNTIIYTSSDTINAGKQYLEYAQDEFSITFFIQKDGKRVFEKIYAIENDYTIQARIKADELGFIDSYDLGLDAGIYYDKEGDKRYATYIDAVAYSDNEVRKVNLKKAAEGQNLVGNITWTVLKSKYFMIAAIPERTVKLRELNVTAENSSIQETLSIDTGRSNIDHSYILYCGPVDYDNLRSFNIGLEEAMSFGWKLLRPISKLILRLLKFLYSLIPNYGMAIIILSIILKLIFYPLTHKSFSSAQKMQQVQPLLKEVQQKYKGDPQKLNQETMKLYKEHGVSPLGGCLPLLIQFPVLFALYPVLQSTIELRHATFMLWIQDLSIPDPYYILPILMGITMFIQQKLMSRTPTPDMDEKQLAQLKTQKFMMYGMPIFFVFIFRSLPAGLVLYWFTYNVLSVFEQLNIRKKSQPITGKEIRVEKK